MFKGKEYIYEVYKEKSFTKAAQNLYISQPALSAAIKKIENRIGCCIFDRSSKVVRLTDAGAEYIRAAETIMDIELRFENYLSNLNELKTGRLSIGASNVFASFILPSIITKFTDKYPMITINLIEAASAQLEELLFAGTLDFVLDNYPLDETIYEKHLFCSENLILTVPPNLPANALVQEYQLSIDDICQGKHVDPTTKAVPLSLFANEPFIFLRSGNDTRMRADKIVQESGFTPNIVLELDQLATAYNVACYGLGATIISDTLAQKASCNSTMLYYKIDSRYTFRNVFFYNKQNKYITKAMEEFAKLAPQADIGIAAGKR